MHVCTAQCVTVPYSLRKSTTERGSEHQNSVSGRESVRSVLVSCGRVRRLLAVDRWAHQERLRAVRGLPIREAVGSQVFMVTLSRPRTGWNAARSHVSDQKMCEPRSSRRRYPARELETWVYPGWPELITSPAEFSGALLCPGT